MKQDSLDKIIYETKKNEDPESVNPIDNPVMENDLFKTINRPKKDNKPVRERTDRQSDRILQNILNASKLLEGRFTFDQLLALDIPTFEAIVDNEFANLDRSLKEFKEKGTINAYTKNEVTNIDEKALKALGAK